MGANNKETYHKRKKQGLCPNCGSMRIEQNKTYCRDCVEMISKLNKDRMDRFRASGLCRLCGDHLLETDRLKNGKMPRLANHVVIIKENMKKLEQENRSKYGGLCSQCGGRKSYLDLRTKGVYYKRCHKCRLKIKKKKGK